MKIAILVSGPLVGISLQLARPRLGCIVLDLHQYLINRGSQWGEFGEPSSGGLGTPILSFISSPSHLPSLVLLCIFLPFALLAFLLSGQ